MLVFIDDSGDPGFRIEKGSSRFFIIALIIFEDTLEAEKTSLTIKELRRELKVSDQYEFKFNKTDNRFKKTFFTRIKRFDFKIRAILVDKKKISSPRLQSNKENFYNFFIMQVIKHNDGYIKDAKLKFDKRGERTLRNELRVYLSHQLDNKNEHIFTDLKFVDSRQNTLIQLADMIAGSINSSYSGKQTIYLEELKDAKRINNIWEFE